MVIRLSGILAILHVSHPLAITSAQQAHPMCCGEACMGTVGGEDVKRGVGGVKRGIRGIILLNVIIANL